MDPHYDLLTGGKNGSVLSVLETESQREYDHFPTGLSSFCVCLSSPTRFAAHLSDPCDSRFISFLAIICGQCI